MNVTHVKKGSKKKTDFVIKQEPFKDNKIVLFMQVNSSVTFVTPDFFFISMELVLRIVLSNITKV